MQDGVVGRRGAGFLLELQQRVVLLALDAGLRRRRNGGEEAHGEAAWRPRGRQLGVVLDGGLARESRLGAGSATPGGGL